MTLNGGRLELLNKIRSGVRTLAFFSVLFFAAPAAAIEITAIDFNGDLIGKVIPDGKVVSLDNQLIGNVTADSLIVNFDGELIGGVIPQGIAIGNDNKLLGKVSNDGSVRLASGKIVGKVLPNGLVVDDYFNVLGAVLFPGLIYSDDGKTVGRLTGDGLYTNLQGQQIGFVSPDGYAYRKVGNDYLLDGRLISSKMVISLDGAFIGSVSPGGNVTDFEAQTIGFVKANGYVYNENNQIIGQIVRSGFAFDNNGKYIGFVTYNGEVVNKDDLVGRMRADGRIADAKGEIIGFAVDLAATATDLEGRYLGRIMPGGSLAQAREVVGQVGPRGTVINKDGKIIGRLVNAGPVFNFRGALRAHALKSGAVISLEGTPLGNVRANLAYDNNGLVFGATLNNELVIAPGGKSLGMSGINASVMDGSERKFVSPFGFLFSSDGVLSGSTMTLAPVYNLTGAVIAYMMPNGSMYNKGVVALGRLTEAGINIDERNRILGRNIAADYAFSAAGELLGILSETNMVLDKGLKPKAKILPDNSVVKAGKNTEVNFNPQVGTASDQHLVLGVTGSLFGYADIDGAVRNPAGRVAGKVVDGGLVIDNSGLPVGETSGYKAVVDGDCALLGVVTPQGDIRNYRETFIGRMLWNGQAVSETGAVIGYQVIPGSVIDFNGNIQGTISPSGQVTAYGGELLGCIDKRGKLRNADGEIIGGQTEFYPVMNVNGVFIGRTVLDGTVVNEANEFIGYMQPNDNVNSKTGVPVGQLFKYRFAFDNDNNFLGRVGSDARVFNAKNEEVGKVEFGGAVLKDGKNIGYALYDMYVYDNDANVIGYITRDGNVLTVNGRKLGRIDKGFLINGENKVAGRGNRDFYIRNQNNVVLGELELNGSLVDSANHVIGSLKDNGRILDSNGNVLAIAKPLQYYSLLKELTEAEAARLAAEKAEAERLAAEQAAAAGNYVIGDDGYLRDANGNIIGRILPDGTVVDLNGNVIGHINENGEFVGLDGKVKGKTSKDGYVVGDDGYLRDANGNIIGRVLPDGTVVDLNGNVIGHINENGEFVGLDGKVMGKVNGGGADWYSKPVQIGAIPEIGVVGEEEMKKYRKSLGIALTPDGEYLGDIMDDGTVVDLNGNVIGHINENGEFVGLDGKVKGKTSKDGYVVGDDGYLRDANGNIIGRVLPDGTVVDLNGNVIGHINENGEFVGLDGKVMGKVNGGGADWYSKPVQIGAIPEIGVVGEEEMKKYRKSLGIALTPDGEYLGDIMDDGSVVDKKGNVVGKKMPDGLIIDDDGTLIGIEEVKKPDSSGMFVPAGTFGPGGAYGTGMGAGGNLGPGGGFGPGERYDPQRAAALAAAQNQRRQAMSVGKISSGIRPESFDGYQKNWDEQGIAKAVSSWRVNLSEMIFADKPIPAVIARSIDSNNPTPVTAFVERNVYAEEGRNVVIPAGSRLMGTLGGLTAGTETTSSSAKVQITWERLIRPDGSLFVFQGITGDAQGRGGALGYLDQQLFKKYTLPIMTTALTSYTSYIMAPKDDDDNSSDTESPRQQAANDARQNFLQDMNRIFEQILADKTNIKPLTYVPAGTRIIVYPNIDLWLRTPERDEAEVAKNLSKRDVLIDDNKLEQDRTDTQNRRKMGMTDADRAATAGSVVYEAEGTDAEAVAAPRLMDDSKVKSKKPAATAGAPALMPTTPAGGSTPPPPPSFSSGSSSSSSSSSSSAAKTDNSVPQLF